MTSFDHSSCPMTQQDAGPAEPSLFGRMLHRLIAKLRFGRLKVMLPTGAVVESQGAEAGSNAIIIMRRWRALRRLLIGGDIGFAEGFIDEDWTTPDLTALLRLAARNRAALDPAIQGSTVMRLINRAAHMLNANTRRGSRRNIEAHYDLGNEFYRQWLDGSMLYSSAIFDDDVTTLEAAQENKLRRIERMLSLKGGESVLEIGCGWGALALHLAKAANANVTGITLSPAQLAWANDAVHLAGFTDSVDFGLQDYRDVRGQFDRIVSIEMFEAVGEAYWPSYFQTLARCLKPGGRAVLQIISIRSDLFESYRRTSDFIQKHIFPGGLLPSNEALQSAVVKSGLKISETAFFGSSYARTLMEWRNRFDTQWPAIAALGFDHRFRRLWDYYLSYCEAGFAEGTINVGLYAIEHR